MVVGKSQGHDCGWEERVRYSETIIPVAGPGLLSALTLADEQVVE